MNRFRLARPVAVLWAALLGIHQGVEPALGARPAKLEIAGVRIGFGGQFKVGFWTPVEVVLRAAAENQSGIVRLTVPDGDGVPTSVTTPADAMVHVAPGRPTHVQRYVKFGQEESHLTVEFLVGSHTVHRQVYAVGSQADQQHVATALPATDELILVAGPSWNVAQALARARRPAGVKTHVVELSGHESGFNGNAASPPQPSLQMDRGAAGSHSSWEQRGEGEGWPTRWFGYEGVDTMVIATSQPEQVRQFVQPGAPLAALREWVELGGRLVIGLGAKAPEILSRRSGLVELIPGTFDRMLPLRSARELEEYTGTSERIEVGSGAGLLEVPRLRDVAGTIEAYEGSQPSDLPLVIRAPRGFGEVVVVTVDLDQPPLKDWKGRGALICKLLGKNMAVIDDESESQSGELAMLGYSDLAGQLRGALDQFQRVRAVPFSVVAALVLLYMLVIGPLDYLLVSRWLKRLELTWITFPTWILLFSAGAYLLAVWLKGNEARMNQAELVDMDCASERVRGAAWMHVFSPRTDTLDLTFEPRGVGNMTPRDGRVLLSWMGLPGGALGGMRGQSGQPRLFNTGYSFSPQLDQLHCVPIPIWSTRSFTARWTCQAAVPLDHELREGPDRRLTGTLRNVAGIDLSPCHLLYDRWVYSIPRLPAGERLSIDEALAPRNIKVWLTQGPYQPTSTDTLRVLQMMMFQEAAGGTTYTRLVNRYQAFCDLTHLLKIGRAILVAQSDQSGSRLLRNRMSLANADTHETIVYRFVIPVSSNERQP
jgi:hypothetical protein